MANISAKDVKELREKTGVGMMECKKALVEADGDMDKAIDFLRERGLAAAQKKASRIAAEGVVLPYYDKAAKKGVVVEVNSETDFVAKNDKFMNFVEGVAKTILATDPADVEALKEAKFDGTDRTVTETLNDLVLAIGENMKVRRFERMEGVVSTYIHAGGSVGVMVGFDVADEAKADTAEFEAMGKNVAMQIAAMSPAYLDQASVPADVVEHEKSILAAQMKEDPKMASKPEQVLAKIAEGKMGKYYKENCLVEQEFVRGDIFQGSVKGYVDSVAKELGTEIKVNGFIRMMKGDGLEKREENFAEEIAKQING
ncbi:MAG: elongation factor Ts [Eubacterium sp.]|nr:elongation factor Ts [Eubacterium sp.]